MEPYVKLGGGAGGPDGRRPRGVDARVEADLEPYVFVDDEVRRRPYDEFDPGALDVVAAQLRWDGRELLDVPRDAGRGRRRHARVRRCASWARGSRSRSLEAACRAFLWQRAPQRPRRATALRGRRGVGARRP